MELMQFVIRTSAAQYVASVDPDKFKVTDSRDEAQRFHGLPAAHSALCAIKRDRDNGAMLVLVRGATE